MAGEVTNENEFVAVPFQTEISWDELKKDAKKGRYAHKRKTKRIFVGSASKADATKPDKNSGLGS